MNDIDIKTKMFSTKELDNYIKIKYPELDVRASYIVKLLRKYYPQYLYYKSTKKMYIYKDIIEKIDFNYMNFFKLLTNEKGIKYTIDLFLRNGYSISITNKLLGIEEELILKILKEGRILNYTDETCELIDRKQVEYWIEFKETHTSLYNIYSNIENEVGKKYNPKKRFKYNIFYKMRSDGTLDRFNVINAKDTCYTSQFGFVKNELKDEVTNFIFKYLENVIVNTYGSRIEILNYYLENCSNKNIEKTLNYLSIYASDKISKTKSITPTRFLAIADEIIKLNKELMDCSDDEVGKILLNLNTKTSKIQYCNFLMYLKEVTETKYSKKYQYDKVISISNTKNIEPYPMDKYLRFGFLCLSNSHVWYEEYMNKALSSRKDACVWLYCVFHYICAWRRIDILNNLPHVNLGMKPNELLKKIKNKELKHEIALDYVNQIKFKIDMLNIQPQKTQSRTTPNLVLEIPESIKLLVGTLIGIVQAHYELSENYQSQRLIIQVAANKRNQQDFFGEEYKNIFGKESFSNLRAVKNFELLTVKNGEEQGNGTGYVLASIARSHKFFGDKKSETTKIYLEHFYKLESSEKILIELYERGVCSFVPYLLTKALHGEKNVINLDIEEQTKLMKNTIRYDNYDTEMIVQIYDKVTERSKETIYKMITEYKNQGADIKEEIEKTLKNIAYNNAPSKNKNVGCIAIAQGKGCLYPSRDVCFGCGYEIYLKSYLNELGKYINNIKRAAYESKTEGSKRKNVMMIKNILVPITEEIFITLKTIYNISDLTEYKKLLK